MGLPVGAFEGLSVGLCVGLVGLPVGALEGMEACVVVLVVVVVVVLVVVIVVVEQSNAQLVESSRPSSHVESPQQ